jgi:chemotaxis protein methyltransferase CheR
MTVNPADFEYIRRFVQQHSAIVLDDTKEYLVTSRLEPLAKRECTGSLDELVRRLRTRAWGDLHSQVVEAMTTNETSFFRDGGPFEALRKEILPALIKRAEPTRQLDIWSAASSSGQEAFSIAMLIDHNFPALAGWKVQVLGTDLAQSMVSRARTGVFKQLEVNRGLPAPMLIKYFEREGLDWKVKDVVRRRTAFHQMSLTDRWTSIPPMDVVFLRNVLIYFDVATKRQILERVRRVLRPDGALFLGSGETTLNLDDNFQPVQFEKTMFYRLKK